MTPRLQPFGSHRVAHRFASALGDASARWSALDQDILRLCFHALRASQQRLNAGWPDEVFLEPVVEQLRSLRSEGEGRAASRISRRTCDAVRLLGARLIAEEPPQQIIEALAEVASRLRIDDLHGLAIDAFLVLIDAVDQRGEERVDEYRCITGVLAISAVEWDVFDSMLASLRESGGRDAAACAWNLEARRWFVRGVLPEAERAARAAVALSQASAPSTPASLACQILGSILGTQGRHREGSAALFQAYQYAPDPYRAHWALACLACGFFYLGRIEAATDCCALLADAESPNIRATALCTAVRIAGLRRDLTELARLRTEVETLLDSQRLIAHAASQICYYLGAALHHVGDRDGARELWARGVDVARSNGVNHMLYLLDDALMSGRIDPDVFRSPSSPESVAAVPIEPPLDLMGFEGRLAADRIARAMEAVG